MMVQRGFMEMTERFEKRFESSDKRFDGMDKKFESIDKRFDEIDKKFEGVDKRLEAIESKLSSMERRIMFLEDKATEHSKELRKLKALMEKIQENQETDREKIIFLEKRVEALEIKVGIVRQRV